MQFIDLKAQQARIKDGLKQSYNDILDHGKYIMGPEIGKLEKALSEYTGTKHAISCSSGTDALSMALMALGVNKGDAVFTTAFSFYATAETTALLGATPIFVDIDEKTYNMDTVKLEDAVKKVIKEKRLNPKAIMAVDLFGLIADYDKISDIAKEYGLKVIEDAAQSFGGVYNDKKACSFGDIGCTSFFPAKPLGCYGDGGAVFTDDDELANIMKSIRVHGKGSDKYDNVRIGLNARMDTVQAGVLLEKLKIFDDELDAKQKVSSRYNEYLSKYADVPIIPKKYKSAWAQYTLKLKGYEREKLLAHLNSKGIPTAIYYVTPMPLLKAFDYLGLEEKDYPVSVDASKKVFSLPMHAYLTDEEFEQIFDAFDAFYKGKN
jgi:UDP-2-acetamido-2-deoxy-ribo-hexuluronate aminotransferase